MIKSFWDQASKLTENAKTFANNYRQNDEYDKIKKEKEDLLSENEILKKENNEYLKKIEKLDEENKKINKEIKQFNVNDKNINYKNIFNEKYNEMNLIINNFDIDYL